MTDRRSITSAENGRKGGRPVSTATLRAQKAREILTEWLENDLQEIYTALVNKAKQGDVPAAKELFDRGWGKAVQGLYTTDDKGNVTPIQGINYIAPSE